MDFTSQSKLFGFGKPIKVKPLTEDDAVNLLFGIFYLPSLDN
jgi:hypothetical protein